MVEKKEKEKAIQAPFVHSYFFQDYFLLVVWWGGKSIPISLNCGQTSSCKEEVKASKKLSESQSFDSTL